MSPLHDNYTGKNGKEIQTNPKKTVEVKAKKTKVEFSHRNPISKKSRVMQNVLKEETQSERRAEKDEISHIV